MRSSRPGAPFRFPDAKGEFARTDRPPFVPTKPDSRNNPTASQDRATAGS
ncbi:MAG: hypothetical protein GDA56_29225 [Hormoscilla sp. GM7CHS1pb]|nr:hypothetical protein [Hormoscilla sp. GM7CHS1pb]